eukprot:6442219-Karenia_brevis.AAC.1
MGVGGNRLQWYKGVLYCAKCGGWTKSRGTPKLLVETCKGKKPMGARIIKAIARDEPLALMRFPDKQWPQGDNNPTI